MQEEQKQLINKIEAILFYSAEPVKLDFLAKTLEVSKKEISSAVGSLTTFLENRGIRTVIFDDEVSLVTAPELSETIEKMIKEERERELGRAGIETLSIVAYKGPVSRKEIDYIRGVNSQFVLRSLLLRGLIERKNSEHDERVMMYNITSDTLRYLGLASVTELPQYEEAKKQLDISVEDNLEEENG